MPAYVDDVFERHSWLAVASRNSSSGVMQTITNADQVGPIRNQGIVVVLKKEDATLLVRWWEGIGAMIGGECRGHHLTRKPGIPNDFAIKSIDFAVAWVVITRKFNDKITDIVHENGMFSCKTVRSQLIN